jgi:hypothetical protein
LSDIFHEIDEELRRENLQKLWTKYRLHILVLIILVLVLTAGFAGWRQFQQRQRDAESARYAAALELAEKGNYLQAADAFGAIARSGGNGQALLARFEEAALRSTKDKPAGIAAYKAIAGDKSVDSIYRDLATLLAATYEIDAGDGKAVIDELAPMTGDGNPWHFAALELTAIARLQSGDKAAARDIYKRLADDLKAPEDQRVRAAETVAALAD